ncbi:AmpG family muropeptide MFS transporter [Stakelama tenebrarum]|uniref:AmpG family muropeptide MFS transporter n=1 Tax=Stakelama tenebrarum TaxID=2711215 RepID=A0A6G6Y6X9_9SPHN|nr:MFS transporter [Sphingosinithalassobacter tenebrarum]QIG80333.1 AmpG family muropeptide MFS transporter [Sphingosinithalassobacter tenebrarum]
MSDAQTGDERQKPRGLALLGAAFTNRKIGVMLAFGFAAGLPYALLLGTLYAWLSDAQVDLETMGVFSLIGLAYAFKFLWSPVIDRTAIPGLERLGRRKSWLIPAQFLLGMILIVLSLLNPQTSLGWFSLLAGVGAFASASQDITIDAWRVDVADEIATLDILSTVYQLGYRIAALAGGALALIIAERTGWPAVYFGMGVAMLVILCITFFAPDTPRPAEADGMTDHGLRAPGELKPRVRATALIVVGLLWSWALVTVIVFMVRSLGAAPEDRPNPTEFIQFYGPLIVAATVIVPSIIAAVLEHWRKTGKHVLDAAEPARTGIDRVLDHGYGALVLPLAELVGRLKWAAILVLALILSYRFTDAVWGTFAYPFYLGELQYTHDEVAIASKFFGVGMTMLGITLSAVLFSWIGRMATVVLGAVIAAASNILYADLAQGGGGLDAFGHFTGIYRIFEVFGSDDRFSRLLLAISGENISGGIAGAAFVAYLSSIASKRYSAVQYALLSSLTFLVGSLGRSALGKAIEDNGYAWVFYLTAAIGMIAVVLAALEWMRERANAYRDVAPPTNAEAEPAR